MRAAGGRGALTGVAAVALLALLAGCSQSSTPTARVSTTGAKGSAHSDAKDSDLVTAVSPGGSSTLLGMRFRLGARPVVGTPLQIEIVLTPADNAEIAHIHAAFQPSDGLQLQSDRELDVSELHAGVPIDEQMTVLPQQAGVLSLTATILLDLDTGTTTRSFTIPLIAVESPS